MAEKPLIDLYFSGQENDVVNGVMGTPYACDGDKTLPYTQAVPHGTPIKPNTAPYVEGRVVSKSYPDLKLMGTVPAGPGPQWNNDGVKLTPGQSGKACKGPALTS